jgi:hypothetical protein
MPELLPAVHGEAGSRGPGPEVLPGVCLYEPKWDGYRTAAVTSESGVTPVAVGASSCHSRTPSRLALITRGK